MNYPKPFAGTSLFQLALYHLMMSSLAPSQERELGKGMAAYFAMKLSTEKNLQMVCEAARHLEHSPTTTSSHQELCAASRLLSF